MLDTWRPKGPRGGEQGLSKVKCRSWSTSNFEQALSSRITCPSSPKPLLQVQFLLHLHNDHPVTSEFYVNQQRAQHNRYAELSDVKVGTTFWPA